MDKVPCKKCGKSILPSTIQKTDGLCMPCYKGPNPKSFWERVQDIAVRKGIMKDTDRVGDAPSDASYEAGSEKMEQNLGSNIVEILTNRKKVDDYILVSHLCGLLMEKENKRGLDSFSKAEKSVYMVGDMIRQLDSGGFGTYFYNTGHLASILPTSLLEVGSSKCKQLVEEAISIYGKVPSEDYDEMLEELDVITCNFDKNPWEDLDDRYYDSDENLGKILMDYVNINREQFSL